MSTDARPTNLGSRFAVPVKARRSVIRERLPSCEESASLNPRTESRRDLGGNVTPAHPFAFAVLRAPRHSRIFVRDEATDSLPASALAFRRTLRSHGTEDARCVLPTSATQSNYVYPHLARSRLAAASFDAWSPHGVEAPCGTTGGPGASRRPRPLRWIDIEHVTSNVLPRGFSIERGRFLPTALFAIDPLTPLSPLPLSGRLQLSLRTTTLGRLRLRVSPSRPLCPVGRTNEPSSEEAAKTTILAAS